MNDSDVAISARGLSKAYTISHEAAAHVTLAEAALSRLRRPLARPQTETFHALKDISFDIQKGDVVGIIGRNGAGKSTLLKVLSRITEPTSGRVDLYGRVGSLLEVGTGFHPELTGRENVFLNGAILGMTKAEIKNQFDAIVDFAGVEKFLDTPVKRYSSGMYVRLAFAVAAHLESEILIVDEVLAVGDAEFQRKCVRKMKDVAGDGRTVLFVSHNMAAIQTLCNAGLLLREGTVRTFGDIESTIQDYMSDGLIVTDGSYDLRGHPARTRHSGEWLKSLTLINHLGRSTSRFTSSSALQARLRVKTIRSVRNPQLALAIEDQHGRRITTSATQFVCNETGDHDGTFEGRCLLPRLGLGPGRYMISVSISELGTGILDSIDGAGWFDVEWDNSYPTGAFHDAVYGPVVTTGKWEVFS